MATPSATPSLPISISTDVGQIAAALAAFFKLADSIVTVLNSPAMLAARKNADVQAAYDRITSDAQQALKTGDMSQVDKELS